MSSIKDLRDQLDNSKTVSVQKPNSSIRGTLTVKNPTNVIPPAAKERTSTSRNGQRKYLAPNKMIKSKSNVQSRPIRFNKNRLSISNKSNMQSQILANNNSGVSQSKDLAQQETVS